MPNVESESLPSMALLKRYHKDGFHTDCYFTEVPKHVSFEQFVLAFYSTRLFRLERYILKWLASRPSTDDDLTRMVSGDQNKFAAWSVEARSENQLLLSDFQGRTRSWLMTKNKEESVGNYHTRLYFGSAVVPVFDIKTGGQSMGLPYKVLLRFHKIYSVALLSAAASKLAKD